MKVGILTYHRTNNYGACLQAVAMRLVLEKMGCEVYYVDYWPDYHANMYKLFSLGNLKGRSFKGKIGYLIRSLNGIKAKKKRIRNFNIFLDSLVNENLGSNIYLWYFVLSILIVELRPT